MPRVAFQTLVCIKGPSHQPPKANRDRIGSPTTIKTQPLHHQHCNPNWTFLGARFDQISFDGQALCGVYKRQIACAWLSNATLSPDWQEIDNETTYVAVAGEYVWAIGKSGKTYVTKWTRSPPDGIKQTSGQAIHVATNGKALCQDNSDAVFGYATTGTKWDALKLRPVPEDPMLLLDLRMRQDDIYALNASGTILYRKLSTIPISSWTAVDGPLRRIALDGEKYLCGVTNDLDVVCAIASVTPEWRLLPGISAIDIDISGGMVVVVTPDRKLYKATIDLTSAPVYRLSPHCKSTAATIDADDTKSQIPPKATTSSAVNSMITAVSGVMALLVMASTMV